MENFSAIAIPILAVYLLLRLMALPIRLVWKIGINSVCGFLCLWLLNRIAFFTGIQFPINAVTVTVAGFLGLPGIGLLALIQAIL